jgi:hypothetical protein
MGMCKGCGQIFKTEDMKYNFCVDCQESNEDKIKEIESDINKKYQYENNRINEQESSKLTSYFTTLIGSFIGLIASTYLTQKLHAPFFISMFAFILILYAFILIFMKQSRPDIKKFYSNNELVIKRLFIVLVIIWNIIIYQGKSDLFVFLGLVPTILIFGSYWAIKGKINH